MKNILQKLRKLTLLMTLMAVTWSWSQQEVQGRYDYRQTHWFGLNSGTITGPGLSYMHWGEQMGFKASMLPVAIQGVGGSDYSAFVLGAAGLLSINEPQPASAGIFGFTNHHAYWFLGGMLGMIKDRGQAVSSLTTASVGIGMDLNRRNSRLSFLLGAGPHWIQSANDPMIFRFLPTIEVSWHFGAARRIEP